MGDDYATNRGGYDCAYLLAAESRGERTAYALGMSRVLKDERALEITRAV
jgi:hypothetical protein